MELVNGPSTLWADKLRAYTWHVVRDCGNEQQAYHTLTDSFERLQENGWEYASTTMADPRFHIYKDHTNPAAFEALLQLSPPYMHHFRKFKEQPVNPEAPKEDDMQEKESLPPLKKRKGE